MFERDSTSGHTIRETRTAEAEAFADEHPGAECAPEPAVRRGTRDRVIRRGWLRCVAVLAEVSAAFFIRELVAHHQPDFAPFITFYPAVLLACLLDGAVAGIAVTVLATVAAAIWIFPPRRAIGRGRPVRCPGHGHLLRLRRVPFHRG